MNIKQYGIAMMVVVGNFLCAAQNEKEPVQVSRVTTLRVLRPTKQLQGVDALLSTNPVKACKEVNAANKEFESRVDWYQRRGNQRDNAPFIKYLDNSLKECEQRCSFFGVGEWAKILTWDSCPEELAVFTDSVAAVIIKMADKVSDRPLRIYRLGGQIGHFNDLVIFAKVFSQCPAFRMQLYHDNNDGYHAYLQNADKQTRDKVQGQFLRWMQQQYQSKHDVGLEKIQNLGDVNFYPYKNPSADVIYALDEGEIGVHYRRLCDYLSKKGFRFSGVMLGVSGRNIILSEDGATVDKNSKKLSEPSLSPPPYPGFAPMAPAKPV